MYLDSWSIKIYSLNYSIWVSESFSGAILSFYNQLIKICTLFICGHITFQSSKISSFRNVIMEASIFAQNTLPSITKSIPWREFHPPPCQKPRSGFLPKPKQSGPSPSLQFVNNQRQFNIPFNKEDFFQECILVSGLLYQEARMGSARGGQHWSRWHLKLRTGLWLDDQKPK